MGHRGEGSSRHGVILFFFVIVPVALAILTGSLCRHITHSAAAFLPPKPLDSDGSHCTPADAMRYDTEGCSFIQASRKYFGIGHLNGLGERSCIEVWMMQHKGAQTPAVDRRKSKRFEVHWLATLRGSNAEGVSFEHVTSVQNLSSMGAFLKLGDDFEGLIPPGSRIEIAINVPLKKQNWISYAGSVIRVESERGSRGVAVRFDHPKPVFGDPTRGS
jgi:hypothetical protein